MVRCRERAPPDEREPEMETILEIRVSHDGKRMVAWDPNAEVEIAEAKIRTGQLGKSEAEAMAYALRVLGNRAASHLGEHWNG